MSEKLDNVPRAIFDSGTSARAKYQELNVGQPGWWPLLRYESVMLVASACPGALGLYLRSRLYPRLLGACGRNVFFGLGVTLRHPHKIRIGDNVVIDDGCVLDAKGYTNRGITIGSGVFVGRHSSLNTKDGDLVLEDGVNIGTFCTVFSASSVRIGAHTLVAGYSYIIGGGHAFDETGVPVIDQARPSRGIAIGEGGWIGAGVSILDGVTIGRAAIVGANAVVTKDLPDFAVAAGTPASILRMRREG
jgi:acetyltransferase-like isoleucine patch superfamily enzyme